MAGTRSLQSNSNSRRKRSFTLPSFPAGRHQAAETKATAPAEEVDRIRKAAAWQWYTRGVGEMVVPTKRPIRGDTLTGGAAAVRGILPKGGEESTIEKKCPTAAMDQSPAADARRAASRFKAEASARGKPRAGASAATIPAGPSPLYDEFELSSLKTHMVDFVQRLQKKESEQRAAKPLNSNPAPAAAAGNHSSTQHLHPPAAGSGVRRSNSASVELKGSGFRRPMSALQKLLPKIMGISLISKNNSAAVQGLEAPPDDAEPDDVAKFHYHHYIHHHHHHYHYGGPSPEEAEFIRRRRHSESSGIRPRIPSLIWEENEVTTEEEEEESPPSAFISRRRRHSDSVFNAEHNTMKKTNQEGAETPEYKDPVKPTGLQLPRKYNSERFTSKIEVPNVVKGMKIGEEHWQGADIRSRRRNSMESLREEGEEETVMWRVGAATEKAKVRGGGGVGGGVYKLGGARIYECTRRRHSESLGVTSRRLEGNVELMYGGSGYDNEEKEGLRVWRRTPSSGTTMQRQGRRSPAQPAVGRH